MLFLVWILCSSILCLMICMPLYMNYKKAMQPALACSFKALGTVCALVLVLVAALKLDSRCWVAVAGMSLHLLADILMEFNFSAGAGFFMAGHFLYIVFFARLFPFTPLHLICFILLFLFSLFLLLQWKRRAGKQLPLFILYSVVICAMTASALAGGFSAYTTSGILMALGGSLFLISDILLIRSLLFRSPRALYWAVMTTYYLSQLLLGAACILL